jgi:D-glycero-D-manno-heptose 1,7-bisphosphate phosphatase
MLLSAADDLDIDLSCSYMIGDKLADVQAGHAAGCRTFLVRTGYGEKYTNDVGGYGARVVSNLPEAVDTILLVGDKN